MQGSIKETLVRLTCAGCVVEFGITQAMYDRRLSDGKGFYCPNGHSNYYKKDKDEDNYKEKESEDELEKEPLKDEPASEGTSAEKISFPKIEIK